jgi:hypothetical protein
VTPDITKKAEISTDGCDELYRESRTESTLTDEKDNEVKLRQDAPVGVTIEADAKTLRRSQVKAVLHAARSVVQDETLRNLEGER